MKNSFLKSIGGTALALLVLVGGMQISVSGQDGKGHEPSLVGVWLTQVTRRNCDTGEPIGATSQIQLTFAKGGTLLETIGPSIFRSPGNGIWKREHGWNEYSFANGSCDSMRPARLPEAGLSGRPSHSTRRGITTRQPQQMTSLTSTEMSLEAGVLRVSRPAFNRIKALSGLV